MSSESRPRRAYRWLLRAYPGWYRERYGLEMEEAFLSLLRTDRDRWGVLGVARCWIGAILDASAHAAALRWRSSGRWTLGIGSESMSGPSERAWTGGGEVMGTVLSDVRYALRGLKRRPVFAATAILTIAIGIGANASVFTVVNGFMLTPLPYEDPEELVAIWAANPELGWSDTDVNWADAWDWRAQASTLEDLAVFNDDGFNLTGGDTPELVSAIRVTPNLLSVLGVRPRHGRDFQPTEMGDGRDGVAILSDGFWERRFARDPDVLGSTLTLDGLPVVVIGILGPDFLFHDGRPDVLRPWDFDVTSASRGGHSVNAIARLRDVVSLAAAREELVAIAADLEVEHPEENEGWTVEVRSLRTDVVGDVASQASVVLMAAVLFILLMACVNVANLLLARASGRGREMSVRIALGAERRRVVRQLLTESAVLALGGGALGLAAALWGYRAIVAALPSTVPPVFQFEMDGTVLAYTAAITLGAALLFGVVPALRATDQRGSAIHEGGRSGVGRSVGRYGSALVVLQTALAVVLLVGGGLLMRSLAQMRSQDFGFDPENVLTVRVALPSAQYATMEESEAYWRDVTSRTRELAGVEEVGTTQSHPLMGSNWGRTIQIVGREGAEERDRTVRLTYASPGLFEALRFRMARGRLIEEADGPEAPSVAIVNEAFVERYLGPEDDPLSRALASGPEWSARIVGVVHDVIERSVDSPPEPALYVPISQSDVRTRSLVIRTAGDPAEAVAAVQEAVWSVDADIPVYDVRTMEALVEDRLGGFAIIGQLMGVFAVLSLILGAVGIYGVTAHAAGRRTAEIGVRLAMGAERTDVVRMVVRQGAMRALLGLGIGLAIAAFVGGAMSSILIGVSPRDPLVFGSVVVALAAVSLLGLYIPARKASRVDPVQALTVE